MKTRQSRIYTMYFTTLILIPHYLKTHYARSDNLEEEYKPNISAVQLQHMAPQMPMKTVPFLNETSALPLCTICKNDAPCQRSSRQERHMSCNSIPSTTNKQRVCHVLTAPSLNSVIVCTRSNEMIFKTFRLIKRCG